MPTIQIVFYWVGTFALGLVGVFMIVAIIVVLMVRAQISRVVRTAEATLFEAKMALESIKDRFESARASVMSNIFGAILKMLGRD